MNHLKQLKYFMRNVPNVVANRSVPKFVLAVFILIVAALFINSLWINQPVEEPPITKAEFIPRGIRDRMDSTDDGFNVDEKINWDFFIWSTYYHETSAILGDNTLSFVLGGDSNITTTQLTFTAYNATDKMIIKAPLKSITPNGTACRWGNYYAITKTLPGMTSLVVSANDKEIQIPVYRPVTVKHDVVTCVAPMVANDKWQETIFAINVYKHYSSWAHFYVRSIVTPLHQLMEAYHNELNDKIFTIQPWQRMSLSHVSSKVFNPNSWMDQNGADAAFTDCLLQYKDSAKYINFVDPDEVLIPRVSYNYVKEFDLLFHFNADVAFFRYYRWDVAYNISSDTEKFQLHTLLSTFKFADEIDKNLTKTKFVTKPEFVSAVSRYQPSEYRENMKERQMSHDQAYVITHLQSAGPFLNQSLERSQPYWGPKYNESDWTSSVIDPEGLQTINSEMNRVRFGPNMGELWNIMPKSTYYRELVDKCTQMYREDVQERKNRTVCFSTDLCHFPESIGISCTNVRAEYASAMKTTDGVNLHFASRSWFSVEDGCIP